MITFPMKEVDTLSDKFYLSYDPVKLRYLRTLSRNLWEGFCCMAGNTSGFEVIAYTGPYKFM